MKKILSILVMVLFGVSSVWAAAGTTTITAYAIYDSNNDSIYEPGGGTVLARGQEWYSQGLSIKEKENKGSEGVESTATGKGYDGLLSDKAYTVYADAISAIDGYYFAKWCDVDTFGAKAITTATTRSYSLKYNESRTIKTYAFFEPIQITSSGVKQHAYTYDVGGASDGEGGKEGLVYFRVNKQSRGMSDFEDCYLEAYSASYDPAGFEIVGEPYHRDGTTYDTVYVKVKFTNQNKAATARVNVVLKAKGPSSKQIRKQMIYGYSDLKPVFTTNPADTVDFTPVTPLATGESKTITIQTIYDKIATQNATWQVTLLDPETKKAKDANDKGFKLLTKATVNEPQVSFTALEGINQADLTAWLVIQATYKDAKPANTVYRDTLILTGDAGKVITLNGAQATTRPISIEHSATETWQEESVEFLTTLSGIVVTPNGFPTGEDENKIQCVWAEGDTDVKVRLSSTMSPGLHTPTVNFASSGVEANLNIEALVYLAQPQVTAVDVKLGNTVRLQWAKVLGATHYVVYGNEVVGDEVVRTSVDTIVVEDPAQATYTYDATSNGKEILAIGKTYEFSVEAVYMPSQVANRMSEAVTATPVMFETITLNDLAEFNLYTGTDLYKEKDGTYGKAQYKEKYPIDLVPTFSATGEPLFGRLYVFGMTTSPTPAVFEGKTGYTILAPTTSAGSDAITPCYIFEPEGKAYKLVATIPNMNMSDKNATYFTLTANSQKYYMTGFCPYATTGYGEDQAGVWLLSGSASAKIDLYLHNLCVYARAHTDNGKIATTQETATGSGNIVLHDLLNAELTGYLKTTAAVLAFATTNENASAPFLPTIHLLGDNELEGGVGCVGAGAIGLYIYAGMHSSPIHVLTKNAKQCTTLSIDDQWLIDTSGSTMRTNGMLNVAPDGAGRPSIDLGNAQTTLNFNGGQMFLKNSTPSSTSYLTTFAIGYRKFVHDKLKATLYGLGDDQGGGNVNFNDGTINCDSLTDDFMEGKYGQYYFNKYTMKCPTNTKINGGSHNCDILACSSPAATGGSPTNKWGETLVSTRVEITNTPTAPFYLAEINFASEPGMLKCVITDDPYYNKTLNDYYADKGDAYRHYSMKAEDDSVTLMVPVQFTDKEAVVEVLTHNWALCAPEVGASSNGYEVSYGGPVTVISDETNKTSYLLFGEVDQYMQEAAKSYTIPEGEIGAGTNVSLSENYTENIENTESYQIEKAQYILKPLVRADEWILFVPPFDITNVYVLESYPESDLENLAETQGKDEALIWQAGSTMDFLYYICNYTTSGESGTNGDLWALYDMWRRNTKYTIGAGKQKLTHFTGRNYDANYYLQRSSGVWDWNGSKFTTDWEYLPAIDDTSAEGYDEYYKATHGDTEYDVVMKKGEVYSLKFPYKYYGYDGWDYWSGKYIIFEGLGQQTIEGSNYHETIRSYTTQTGKAVVRGNSTFASMDVTNAYFLEGGQKFIYAANPSDNIYPASGYVVANATKPSPMPQRIASIDMMTGDVTYEPGDGSENTVTGTPTIAGEREMLVYTVAGGLGVVPVVPQYVSIYNAAGQLVVSQYLTDNTQFALPIGIYLVRGEKDQAKAMVK